METDWPTDDIERAENLLYSLLLQMHILCSYQHMSKSIHDFWPWQFSYLAYVWAHMMLIWLELRKCQLSISLLLLQRFTVHPKDIHTSVSSWTIALSSLTHPPCFYHIYKPFLLYDFEPQFYILNCQCKSNQPDQSGPNCDVQQLDLSQSLHKLTLFTREIHHFCCRI